MDQLLPSATNDSPFGDRVVLARQKAAFSASDLARLTGVSVATISRVCRNLVAPRPGLRSLLDVFIEAPLRWRQRRTYFADSRLRFVTITEGDRPTRRAVLVIDRRADGAEITESANGERCIFFPPTRRSADESADTAFQVAEPSVAYGVRETPTARSPDAAVGDAFVALLRSALDAGGDPTQLDSAGATFARALLTFIASDTVGRKKV